MTKLEKQTKEIKEKSELTKLGTQIQINPKYENL